MKEKTIKKSRVPAVGNHISDPIFSFSYKSKWISYIIKGVPLQR